MNWNRSGVTRLTCGLWHYAHLWTLGACPTVCRFWHQDCPPADPGVWPTHGPCQLACPGSLGGTDKGLSLWNNTLYKCSIWMPATKLVGSTSKYLLWVLSRSFVSSLPLLCLGWPNQYERYKESQNVITKTSIKRRSTPSEQAYNTRTNQWSEPPNKENCRTRWFHWWILPKRLNKISKNLSSSLPKSVRGGNIS